MAEKPVNAGVDPYNEWVDRNSNDNLKAPAKPKAPKNVLSSGCHDVGIRYEHLPELGIASDQRQALTTQAEYDALFAHYKRTWLPKQGAALKQILGWIGGGERVALTCYEHLPHQCHRHCVAEALESEAGEHLSATHL